MIFLYGVPSALHGWHGVRTNEFSLFIGLAKSLRPLFFLIVCVASIRCKLIRPTFNFHYTAEMLTADKTNKRNGRRESEKAAVQQFFFCAVSAFFAWMAHFWCWLLLPSLPRCRVFLIRTKNSPVVFWYLFSFVFRSHSLIFIQIRTRARVVMLVQTDDVDFIDQGTEKFLFVWVCTYPIREKNETPLNPLALSLANDFIMCFFLSFDVEHSLQFFLFLLLCLALVYIPSKTKIFHIDAIWSLANCWPKIDTFVRSDTRLQAFTNSLKLRCQFSEQSPQIRSTTTFIVGPIAVSTGNCSFLMDLG